jgi:hypothetical protein
MTEESATMTRRVFLQGTAAALAAVPMVVPASALGRAGHAAPGDRITVGFIGCGKMANDFHLPTVLGFADVQALAVCDVDSSRRAHAKQRVQDAYSKDDRASKECAEYSDFRSSRHAERARTSIAKSL